MQFVINNPKLNPLRIGPFHENNFCNFHKNNIKMSKIKKSAEKIKNKKTPGSSNENYLSFTNEDKKEFKITQYPIIKTSNTEQFIPFKDINKLIIYEHNFNQADFETAKDFRKYLKSKKFKKERNNLDNLNNSPESQKKRASQNKRIFCKRGLFNKNLEDDFNKEETFQIENSFEKKELLTEMENKHSKIVDKLKKKNFYEPIVKLPYVCIKSDKGAEGTLSLNYKKFVTNPNSEEKVKRSQSKIFQKKYSRLKYNINEDGEALFKRIFDKNFKINDRTFGSLDLV